MKKWIAKYAIFMAIGILLGAVGWHALTWQFWAWVFPLQGLQVLHDWAVLSSAKINSQHGDDKTPHCSSRSGWRLIIH